ncbi:MAG: universal stress protein [Pyrinomonadaceae bacterium]
MKVLLAIEDSEFSSEAIRKCGEIFGDSDKNEIRVVSAMERMFMPTEPFAVSAEYVERIDNETEKNTEAVIKRAEAKIQTDYPLLAKNLTTALLIGSPEQAIVEEAESWNADLILLGSHGYGFWQRAVLGSVSNAVLHHAPCSVLIVRSAAAAAAKGQ